VTKEETRIQKMRGIIEGKIVDSGELDERICSLLSDKPKKLDERLLEIKKAIDEGSTFEEIADSHFDLYVRYYKGLEKYKMLKSKPRNHHVDVIVIQGPTGTGKSKWAMDNYPNAYWKQRSNWWDNYEDQETVIIDEFYGWLPFDLLLRLCDRYPLLVETKGGQVQFIAKTIIITTNALPSSWYKSCYFPSFARRVTKWMVMPILGNIQEFTDWSAAQTHMVDNLITP
jgi:hypothetical protein